MCFGDHRPYGVSERQPAPDLSPRPAPQGGQTRALFQGLHYPKVFLGGRPQGQERRGRRTPEGLEKVLGHPGSLRSIQFQQGYDGEEDRVKSRKGFRYHRPRPKARDFVPSGRVTAGEELLHQFEAVGGPLFGGKARVLYRTQQGRAPESHAPSRSVDLRASAFGRFQTSWSTPPPVFVAPGGLSPSGGQQHDQRGQEQDKIVFS